MLLNYLSTSGTIRSIQGNDAKAPYAYWNHYSYRAVTSGEISSLTNNNVYTRALSLSPGQYTCLEITFQEPVYVGQFRCYLDNNQSPVEIALSYPHKTENPNFNIIDLIQTQNVEREDCKGLIRYYDCVEGCIGYLEGESISILPGYVELVASDYTTVFSGGSASVVTGMESKSIRQIIEVTSGTDYGDHIQLILQSPPSATTTLDKVFIAPIAIENTSFTFNENVTNDNRAGKLSWWYSDDGLLGHFEGRRIPLDYGTNITGAWSQWNSWVSVDNYQNNNFAGYTIRQIIPNQDLTELGDGFRITLSGSSSDVVIKNISCSFSNSNEISITLSDDSTYKQDLKNIIDRWVSDGDDADSWEEKYTGHFEAAAVDIDDGEDAIMYSENVIGIKATSHGLNAGDYIRIYGTEYYDGYYNVLTYSTTDIIVIWGIYDPETFTSEAKIRKPVSLGPHFDDYGNKPDCRGILPYAQVNFSTGVSAYIISYSNQGISHGSVKLGPEEYETQMVTSIYDVVTSDGVLSNSPGLSITPDFQQGIPDPNINSKERKWSNRFFYDDSMATPDIGNHAGGYYEKDGSLWTGAFSFISESSDPEYEGDKTGWAQMYMLFDQRMAQPPYVVTSTSDCPYITMCYRGPIPAKFILDMGEPKLFNKYRFWIQLWICSLGGLGPYADFPITVGYPRSWNFEASNHGSNLLPWDLLQQVEDYPLADYASCETPPDGRVGGSCASGDWNTCTVSGLYRYYRFNVYESWTCTEIPGNFECCHIDEIDFVEHRCTAGVIPSLVYCSYFVDKLEQIIPDEIVIGDSKITYALSFDGGNSFEVFSSVINKWCTVVRDNEGQWEYFDGLIWRPTDEDKPEENNLRFALWYAFSIHEHRMYSDTLSSIPPALLSSKLPHGGYIQIAVGLISSGVAEAGIQSIKLKGNIFNPDAVYTPIEITFSGSSGCTVPSGLSVTSDWINPTMYDDRDLIFIMDFDSTSVVIPQFVYDQSPKYFYRENCVSYDLQVVDSGYYTTATGVILISSIDSRQSSTITLPATGHGLSVGSYIRSSGISSNYDGYYYIQDRTDDTVDVVSRHWENDNPVPSGAYIQCRYSIGSGGLEPHVQVGSIIEFNDLGGYLDSFTAEASPSGFYYVTCNYNAPSNVASYAFDDSDVDYHSGQPISHGSVSIGLHLNEAKVYDKIRFRSSTNDWYWLREFPNNVVVGGSNLDSPSLDLDSAWDTLWSGTVVAPVGPGRMSGWAEFTASGTYNNYRIKIIDNNGEWYDALRIGKIEFDSVSTGYTFMDTLPGFGAGALFDGSDYSEFVASGTSTNHPWVHLDFRHKPRIITGFRFKSATGNFAVDSGFTWSTAYPKSVLLSISDVVSPSDFDWVDVYTKTLTAPSAELTWGSLVSVSGLDPHRHYRFKFLTNQGGGYNIRTSELDLEYTEDTVQTITTDYNDSYPYSLLDLAPWHKITGGDVQVVTPFSGEYAEQVGCVGSGSYDNSFWTIVDMHWKLQNDRAITQIGIYSDTVTNITFKLFKHRTGSEWFDISDITTVTHSGNGFTWFSLSTPSLIPSSGDYYLGWYQPNYPVHMGTSTGSGLVSYQYGNLTGTNINLPLHNTLLPSLAARYSDCFSIGTDSDNDALMSVFSPVLDDHTYSFDNTYGYFIDPKTVKIYRQSSLTQSGSQGQIKINIYYQDMFEDSYDVLEFAATSSGCVNYTRSAGNLVDGSRSTDFYSYKQIATGYPLSFIVRFDRLVKLVGFRYRASSASSTAYFPEQVDVYSADSLLDPLSTGAWTSLYSDKIYSFYTTDYWGPWVYLDGYLEDYRYYLFTFSHDLTYDQYISIGDLELVVQYEDSRYVCVSGTYNVISGISNDGMHDGEVCLRSTAGDSREIKSIYNTFSSYGRDELSPGTYFYRGENTPWDDNTIPSGVKRNNNDIALVDPTFAGMNLITWHTLSEPSGDFADSVGDATAYRNGTISCMTGRRQQGASCIDDEDVEGYASFTMPHHLSDYTVCFWFMPKHEISNSYERYFDIMGSWGSYGAIPGSWHISMSKHYLFSSTPYPSDQTHIPETSLPYWGNMYFGNYGGCIKTSRNYWAINKWYHIAFAFRASGTSSYPYRCWINGVVDEEATWQGYDNSLSVYPPSDVIMVNPSDIHYDDYDYKNCMYFGLPLEGGTGDPFEFGLQHVMHFNKFLSDGEVFKVFRFGGEVSDVWSGIYFSETQSIQTSDKLVINFDAEKCVTKYGLLPASGTTGVLGWQLVGSGTGGEVILDEICIDTQDLSDYINIANINFYPTYIINFTTASGNDIDGIRMVDVPLISSVSGNYSTTTSGIQSQEFSILQLSTEVITSSGIDIEFYFSRDAGETWQALTFGLWGSGSMAYDAISEITHCQWESLGSGTLHTKHTFVSSGAGQAAVLPFLAQQTTWSAAEVPVEVSIDKSFGNGDSVQSDYLSYRLDSSLYHYVIFDFSDTGGNTIYSDGAGYFIHDYATCDLTFPTGGTYSCSGSYVISGIISRGNDLISFDVASTSGLQQGDTISISGMESYDGQHIVDSVSGTHILSYISFDPYLTTAGAYYRKIISPEVVIGSEVASGVYVTNLSGNYVMLSSGISSQLINFVYDVAIDDYGVSPLSASGIIRTTVSGSWYFTNLGRLSFVRVNSYEPGSTNIYHGVTFDGGNSFKIWNDRYWMPVVQLSGTQWYYYNNGWNYSSPNTPFNAFRNSIEVGGYQFSSNSLESVEEMDWHASGGITSISGSIGFISYIEEGVRHLGYEVNFQSLPSGIHTLIPSGYSYSSEIIKQDVVSSSSFWNPYYLVDGDPNTIDTIRLASHGWGFHFNNRIERLVAFRMRAINNNSTWYSSFPKEINVFKNSCGSRQDCGALWVSCAYNLYSQGATATPRITVPPPSANHGWSPWVPIPDQDITISKDPCYQFWIHSRYGGTGTAALSEMEFMSIDGSIRNSRFFTHDFIKEDTDELLNGRSNISELRVYIANPTSTTSGAHINEIALIDCASTSAEIDIYFHDNDYPVYSQQRYFYQYNTSLAQDHRRSLVYSLAEKKIYAARYSAAKNVQSLYSYSRSSNLQRQEGGFSGNRIVNGDLVQVVINGINNSVMFFNPSSSGIYTKYENGYESSISGSGFPILSSGIYANSFWNPKSHCINMLTYGDPMEFWALTSGSPTYQWNRYASISGPPYRQDASITYDSKDHCVWLFGGCVSGTTGVVSTHGDFWKFDIYSKSWEQIVSETSPSTRYGAALAFNPTQDYLVLYGGASTSGVYKDTWVYDKSNEKWVDMTSIYGYPFAASGVATVGNVNSALFYDSDYDCMFLLGGGLRLNILSVSDIFEPQYFFNKSNCKANYEVSMLHDEYVNTGGILLNEGEIGRFRPTGIPAASELYFAEVLLYYDTHLGPPSGINITPDIPTSSGVPCEYRDTMSISSWERATDYVSSYIWSVDPLEGFTVEVHNTNVSGTGPIRIYEVVVNPLTYSGTWSVDNNFNLIESSYTTCLPSVSGYTCTFQVLAMPQLEMLISDDEEEQAVPILPTYGVALESTLHEFGGKSQEIRAYLDSASGITASFYTQVSGSNNWSSYTPTWSGSYFSYVFSEPENVRKLRIILTNPTSNLIYSNIRWLKSIQLLNCGDEIAFGPTGSGPNQLELPTRYSNYNKIQIYNNNKSGTYANARVLPRFSGDYSLDRTIQISEDGENWSNLDTGINFPDDYSWEMGKFNGTEISGSYVILDDTSTSGTWRSPVIEVLDPSSTAAYVYVRNIGYEKSYINEDFVSISNTMKIRASDTRPMQLFLVSAVDTDQYLGIQAPWKVVLFDSSGNPVQYNSGSSYKQLNAGAEDYSDLSEGGAPRRYWSPSDVYLWQFYGMLDSRGYAGISLGLQWGDSVDGITATDEDTYTFHRGFPSVGSYSESSYGSNQSLIHIYTDWDFWPVFNRSLRYVNRSQGSLERKSWQMVDIVYRPDPFYELYQENYYSNKQFHARNIYSFEGSSSTPEYDNEIDYIYSFEGTLDDLESNNLACAACPINTLDEVGDYYWLHYACEGSVIYYRTLLVNGSAVQKEFTDICRKFNFMVEAGLGIASLGFWGITQTGVYWYNYDGVTLTEVFGVTSDGANNFKRIHHACVDFMNNLWFIDLATEKVTRINFITQEVDYTRVIQGASSVACDPFSDSAYVYIVRDPEFPSSDCVRLVSVSYDFLEPEIVCSVPNIPLVETYNVNLITRSTSPSSYYDVLPEDPLWGEGEGSLPWTYYSAGSPTLPKGIYKQLKLTLRREDISSASPSIEYLRIPIPAVINKIPWKGYKDILIDTASVSENPDLEAGTYTVDLLVWWARE